jgi:hypothetical protein
VFSLTCILLLSALPVLREAVLLTHRKRRILNLLAETGVDRLRLGMC